MRRICLIFLLLALAITGCSNRTGSKREEIIIFHAGSLSVPFKQLADEYEKRNPGVKVVFKDCFSTSWGRSNDLSIFN